jgi:ADP-ribosylglycohydrolase
MRPPATGADDAQADCVARLAPLLALYAGDPRLMQLVAAVTRVTQASSTAVAWAVAAAAVLERLMQGQGAAAAVRETADELRRLQHQPDGEQQQQQPLQQDTAAGRLPISGQLAAQVAAQLERVLQLARAPHAEAVEQLGRNCHLPNSAQTPLHAVLHQEWLLAQQGGGNCGGMLSLQAPADKQRVFAAAVRDALAAGGCCASRAGYAGACLGAMLGGDAVPRAWLDSYEAAGRVQELSEALCDAREAA